MAKLRRFRVESLQGLAAGDAVPLSAAEARHIHVLRLGAGTQVELADGSGTTALAELVENASGLGARLITVQSGTARAARLILATAWPKGKRAAWLVEKSSELGVDRIVPLRAARSVVRWEGPREAAALDRLRRVAREAVMQSRRCWLPEITGVLAPGAVAGAALAEPGGGRPGLDRPGILVGPEGGWSPDELAAAEATVSLGGLVLRAETAALTAGALLGALRVGLLNT
jgi:16S rRNA (uracil1498-N3)-methyltransferase